MKRREFLSAAPLPLLVGGLPASACPAEDPGPRYVVAMGATLFNFDESVEHLADPGWVVVQTVPATPDAGERSGYPRPGRYQRTVGHELLVGTVDEIVANFREKLERTVARHTAPDFQKENLARQQEVLAAAGITEFTTLPPASKERLEACGVVPRPNPFADTPA